MPSEFDLTVADLRRQLRQARVTIDELRQIVDTDGSLRLCVDVPQTRRAAMVQLVDASLAAAHANLVLLATS